jgi:hypothetical protein
MFYSAEGNLCNNNNNKTNEINENNDMVYNISSNAVASNAGRCESPINDPKYYSNNPVRDSASNKNLTYKPSIQKSQPVEVKEIQHFEQTTPFVKTQPKQNVKPQETDLLTDIVNSGSELLSSFLGLFSSNKKTEKSDVSNKMVENKAVEKFTEDKPLPINYDKPSNEPIKYVEHNVNQSSNDTNNTSNQVTGYGVMTDFEQVPYKYEILPSNKNTVCESCNVKACANELPVPYEFDIMTDKFKWDKYACLN